MCPFLAVKFWGDMILDGPAQKNRFYRGAEKNALPDQEVPKIDESWPACNQGS